MLVSTNRLGLNCLSTYEHGMFVLVQALGTGRQSTVKHVCVILLLVCKHSQTAYSKLVSHLECYKRVSVCLVVCLSTQYTCFFIVRHTVAHCDELQQFPGDISNSIISLSCYESYEYICVMR